MLEAIKTALADATEKARKNGNGDTAWTKAIKEELVLQGHRLDHFVAAKDIEKEIGKSANNPDNTSKGATADYSEWLYDLCWLDYDWGTEPRQFKGLVLAVESEWRGNFKNIDDILDDFEKLICARAKCRLMIFQGENNKEILNSIKALRKIVDSPNNNMTQDNDAYIFVGYNKATSEHGHDDFPFFIQKYLLKGLKLILVD